MNIWAIGDPHLSFCNGELSKPMDKFGPQWKNHAFKIRDSWLESVNEEDVVLLVGDISWAMKSKDVLEDLAFLGELPGKKILIKGNHDFWWASNNKVKGLLNPNWNMTPLNNDLIEWCDVCFAGLRLWDIPGLNWCPYFPYLEGKPAPVDENVFNKELKKLENLLSRLLVSGCEL